MNSISKLVANINSGIKYNIKYISLTKSKQIEKCLELLFKKGIILSYAVNKYKIKVCLNFHIKNLELINQNQFNRKIFLKHKNFEKHLKGANFFIITIKKGIFLDIAASSKNIGGRILFIGK